MEPYVVAMYLNRAFIVKGTKDTMATAMYSINWVHRVMGLDSPTENALVKLAYEGAIRLCKSNVRKKDALPIGVEK